MSSASVQRNKVISIVSSRACQIIPKIVGAILYIHFALLKVQSTLNQPTEYKLFFLVASALSVDLLDFKKIRGEAHNHRARI